jgi:hypothetical protein
MVEQTAEHMGGIPYGGVNNLTVEMGVPVETCRT